MYSVIEKRKHIQALANGDGKFARQRLWRRNAALLALSKGLGD